MGTKLTPTFSLLGALVFTSAAYAQSQVPSPWQWTDVGTVGTPGQVVVGPNDTWQISGAGSDIWGSTDSFVYVYQPVSDGGITAQVDGETNTSPFAKTGVMIRLSLDPGSPEVILDVKPDGGIEFMKRSTPGGETTFIAGGSVPVTPDANNGVKIGVTLQLGRLGHTVRASYCTTSCTDIGSTDFADGSGFIGVAVTSHDPSTLNTASVVSPQTASPIVYPWSTSDVGAVTTTGSAAYEDKSGTFFVSGDGSDIWGTADSFRSVTERLIGDSQLVARVVSEDGTNAFAKAGLMISTDLSAGAPRVVLDVKPDGGIEFMSRAESGGTMSFIAGAAASFPVWLRLTRTGDQFNGELSPDGESWTTVGSVSVGMPTMDILGAISGGFAVTSHDPGALNTAILDNVGVSSGIPGPIGPNLLVNDGFENSLVPDLEPGWASDTPLRQTPAVSETSNPRSGAQNGACHATSGDCGIYQDVRHAPGATGNMLFSVYARADHPGALVGVNVNGQPLAAARVLVGGYQRYTVGFCTCSVPSSSTPVIRVWMYAPGGGVVDIDDAVLVEYSGPR
jgi:hypothetical protein